MIGEQFYPTPKAVIKKMLAPYNYSKKGKFKQFEGYCFAGKSILEPSAGKGDILDFISETNEYSKPKIFAIELDNNLSQILKGKQYRVIGNDFLDYNDDYFFDYIFMNPPFNQGVDHVLKAWEVVKGGGDVVALVNQETVLNPCSQSRVLLNTLIEDHGSIELLDDCFSDAERQTNVKIAIIRLSKPEEDNPFTFSFEAKDQEEDFKLDQEIIGNEVALNDTLGYDKIL